MGKYDWNRPSPAADECRNYPVTNAAWKGINTLTLGKSFVISLSYVLRMGHILKTRMGGVNSSGNDCFLVYVIRVYHDVGGGGEAPRPGRGSDVR